MLRPCHSPVFRRLAIQFCAVTLAAAAQAAIVATVRDEVRTPMADEGYLEFKSNPTDSEFGEEWTGWVDVRAPAMDGLRNTNAPFDRCSRIVEVKTITVSDRNSVAASPNIRRDFDYACKVWAQLGLSVIRRRDTNNEAATLNGMGTAPNVAWPINRSTEDNAMKTLNRASKPAVNLYYIKEYKKNESEPIFYGLASFPQDYAGHDGIGLADPAVDNTLAHELGHMLLNAGNSLHTEAPNIMDAFNRDRAFDEVGPVGGKDVFTDAQITRAFTPPSTNCTNCGNAGQIQQLAGVNDHRYGNVVDWNFVADHRSLQLLTNADNHLGEDALFWEIGDAQAPPADNTHDNAALGVFEHPGSFAGQAFRYADVLSLALRYSDYDQDTNKHLRARAKTTTDYRSGFLTL